MFFMGKGDAFYLAGSDRFLRQLPGVAQGVQLMARIRGGALPLMRREKGGVPQNRSDRGLEPQPAEPKPPAPVMKCITRFGITLAGA